MKRFSVLSFLLFLCIYSHAQSRSDSRPEIFVFKTNRMSLIYPGKGLYYLVPHTARCFENAVAFNRKFWNYNPARPVTIFFNDFTDMGNGGARVSPNNFLNIAVAPFNYTFDILPANERLNWLMNHENTHLVTCDKPAGSDIFFRKILAGKIYPVEQNPITMLYSYLTMPRWYCPRWYQEGIATFMETWMSGGMGRSLGSYDEMVFRAMIRDSAYIYRPVGLESEGTTIDFMVGANAYLYGTRFNSYLGLKYGTDKLREFYSRDDSSRRFFARQFKKVYSQSLSQVWNSWITYENKHQLKNLEKIKQFPLSKVKHLSESPMGSVSDMFYNEKKHEVYAAVNYPRKLAHFCSINLDNGEIKKIAPVPSSSMYYVTYIAYDDSTNTLFYSDKNSYWRGLRALNTETGKSKKLLKFLRAGDFAFNQNDRSLYAIQNFNGRTSVIRLKSPYKSYNTLYTLPFGYSMFNLAVSPNGKLMSATVADMNGKQKLVMFNLDDLLAGKSEYTGLYEFEENNASNFRFSRDGKSLIGTSYYTGVSNVYRFDIEKKQIELLTNTETGFFKPVEIGKDSLIVLEYHHDGFQPCLLTDVKPLQDATAINYMGQEVVADNPQVKDWTLPKMSNINIDSLALYEGKYNSFRNMELISAYPVVLGYKDDICAGYQLGFMDIACLTALNMNISYSPGIFTDTLPEKQKIHASFDYNYFFLGISGTYNMADFYDMFGPSKLSRAGYSLTISYKKDLPFFPPWKYGYSASLSGYWDLEKLPGFQEINATEKKLYTATVSGSIGHLRKSLGAISDEQGFLWKVWLQGNYVASKFFPSVFSTFDFGFLLPWKNSTFWVKTAAGQGFAERLNPFSNFYFGSFRFNYIDTKEGSRQLNRDIWSFPGIDIDEAGGKNFARIKLETALPPVRFRKFGFLGFYVTYMKLNVFGSGLTTNFDIPHNKELYGIIYNSGAQLDFELVLFSLMKSTLSAGFARAYRLDMKPVDEFMISLRLL